MKTRFSALLLISTCMALAGCVAFTPAIDTNDSVDPEYAYIYGAMEFNHAGLKMGLSFVEQGKHGKTYNMRMENSPLSIIEVKPGTYVAKDWLLTNYSFDETGRMAIINRTLSQPFTVEAGKVYFFANISGAIKRHGYSRSWNVTGFDLNFWKATRPLRNHYKQFDDFEAERALPDGSDHHDTRSIGEFEQFD